MVRVVNGINSFKHRRLVEVWTGKEWRLASRDMTQRDADRVADVLSIALRQAESVAVERAAQSAHWEG
jgi:ssRNA-specific RNase YbeY (16S rRNA maturation enzyme)